jgi:hypothetical protein
MEIQANPDLEQLKLIIWIAGMLLMIMLMVIGRFLWMQIEASRAIADALNALKVVVTALKTQTDLQNPVMEKRLNDHAADIKDLKNRVTIIETEHTNFHKVTRVK